MTELTKDDLNFYMSLKGWEPHFHEPRPRMPILAIIAVNGVYDDDMDIDDEDYRESVREDVGDLIPVCGVAFDGNGRGDLVITPFCVKASDKDGPAFISWGRVRSWRYLAGDEAGETWKRRIAEVEGKNDEF